MATNNKLGEFTYDSYLLYLIEREMRARAERIGFIDAGQYEASCNSFRDPGAREGYDVGWHLGKMYLTKAQHKED